MSASEMEYHRLRRLAPISSSRFRDGLREGSRDFQPWWKRKVNATLKTLKVQY